MVFPIAGGTQDTSYEIENSLRFNDDDTAYLNRTRSSQSNTTGTFSVWTKMGNVGADNILFGGHTDVNNRSYIYFSDPDGYAGIFSRTSGSADINFATNARYRDPSAWYHVVVAIDTTQGTEANRFKMYVNGEQLSSFSASSYPSQNASLPILNQAAQTVGGGYGSSAVSAMAEGYMADAYYVDGTQYAASDFGETNDNGVWIPKKFTGSFGTNGFKLEFQQTGTGTASASTIGADTGGNDNHLTSNNLAATDVTTDTPTNNFCTLNPLSAKTLTFSEGNLHATDDGAAGSATGTIAPTNGKWYFEITLSGSANFSAGVVNLDDWPSGTDIYSYGEAAAVLIESNANYNVTYGNTASSPSTLQTGTQLLNATYGFAMDIDNNDLYVSANGNWYTGSAFDNTSFSSASAVTTDLPSNVPLTAFIRQPDSGTAQCNFGNPAISISSGNADANGYGNFEYAVPSGYYSICTKNLAEFG